MPRAARPAVDGPMMQPAKYGDAAKLKRMLFEGKDVNEVDRHRSTALMHSAFRGHLDCVKILVEAGADVSAQNSRLFTALHYAYKGNHEDVIGYLLAHGAEGTTSTRNDMGQLPSECRPAARHVAAESDLPKVDLSTSEEAALADIFSCVVDRDDECLSLLYDVPVAMTLAGLQWTRALSSSYAEGGVRGVDRHVREAFGRTSPFHDGGAANRQDEEAASLEHSAAVVVPVAADDGDGRASPLDALLRSTPTAGEDAVGAEEKRASHDEGSAGAPAEAAQPEASALKPSSPLARAAAAAEAAPEEAPAPRPRTASAANAIAGSPRHDDASRPESPGLVVPPLLGSIGSVDGSTRALGGDALGTGGDSDAESMDGTRSPGKDAFTTGVLGDGDPAAEAAGDSSDEDIGGSAFEDTAPPAPIGVSDSHGPGVVDVVHLGPNKTDPAADKKRPAAVVPSTSKTHVQVQLGHANLGAKFGPSPAQGRRLPAVKHRISAQRGFVGNTFGQKFPKGSMGMLLPRDPLADVDDEEPWSMRRGSPQRRSPTSGLGVSALPVGLGPAKVAPAGGSGPLQTLTPEKRVRIGKTARRHGGSSKKKAARASTAAAASHSNRMVQSPLTTALVPEQAGNRTAATDPADHGVARQFVPMVVSRLGPPAAGGGSTSAAAIPAPAPATRASKSAAPGHGTALFVSPVALRYPGQPGRVEEPDGSDAGSPTPAAFGAVDPESPFAPRFAHTLETRARSPPALMDTAKPSAPLHQPLRRQLTGGKSFHDLLGSSVAGGGGSRPGTHANVSNNHYSLSHGFELRSPRQPQGSATWGSEESAAAAYDDDFHSRPIGDRSVVHDKLMDFSAFVTVCCLLRNAAAHIHPPASSHTLWATSRFTSLLYKHNDGASDQPRPLSRGTNRTGPRPSLHAVGLAADVAVSRLHTAGSGHSDKPTPGASRARTPGSRPITRPAGAQAVSGSSPEATSSAAGTGRAPSPGGGALGKLSESPSSRRVVDMAGHREDGSVTDRVVFLGGACNPTTWRKDVAIPFLESHEVDYYNPQVDDWYPELVAMEANAKDQAHVLLFVLAKETRGIASMIEVAELIARGRQVVLVLEALPDRSELQFVGEEVSQAEYKDLTRAREYLADVARRHGRPIHATVDDGLREVVEVMRHASKLARDAADGSPSIPEGDGVTDGDDG